MNLPKRSLCCGLREPVADADGKFNGAYHPKEQSLIVQGMSWWGLGTGILAITHGEIAMGTAVCITAVFAYAYWWKPKNGLRRLIDMINVNTLLAWHLYAVSYSDVKVSYYSIISLGIIFYILSWVAIKQGDTWLATFLHMALTACANISGTLYYIRNT